jgi:hypothetical protein
VLPDNEGTNAVDHKKPEADFRVIRNLLRCGEVTALCMELRRAVLRQTHPDGDIEKLLMAEFRLAKERAWRRNSS